MAPYTLGFILVMALPDILRYRSISAQNENGSFGNQDRFLFIEPELEFRRNTLLQVEKSTSKFQGGSF